MADNKAGEPQPGATDLFSSAKLVAEAAQSCYQGGTDKVDKEKVAGAAADLLGAASQYGKFEEKGFGQYLGKAETYLEQYSSRGGSAPAPAADPAPAPAAADPAPAPAPAKAESEAKPEGGGPGEDLMKAAKGFLGGL
ncbi:hypothetical protein Taro_006463 [Colocasia esculenta]|uniref:Nodulin-related protein 1 n=1 Tax=Colocasia esculenta TaxID=4460 RepID=A0A843TX40_COLES|nr:hypothetical protein [Colocasia esculenta]